MTWINVLHRITALIAAITLLYNTSGYVIVYQQLTTLAKHSNHLAIEKKQVKEQIILLSFNKTDIKNGNIDFIWKHSKEFKYNGSMYDIVERIDSEDSVYFYCFLDEKENKLEANFNRHFEKDKEEKSRNSSGGTMLAQLITDLYLSTQSLNSLNCYRQNYSPSSEVAYTYNEPDIPSPPPKKFITNI